jgi:hypothetical protein
VNFTALSLYSREINPVTVEWEAGGATEAVRTFRRIEKTLADGGI